MNFFLYLVYKDVCFFEFIYMYLFKFCFKNFFVNCEIDIIDLFDISDVFIVFEIVL